VRGLKVGNRAGTRASLLSARICLSEVVEMREKTVPFTLSLLCVASALLLPEVAQARGGGMVSGGMAMSGGMGGMRAAVHSPFARNFPFFGGGAGFFGGYPDISEPFAAPIAVPQPRVISGPMQVQVLTPQALPQAFSTRTIFVDGAPTTVTESLVTEYSWPSTPVSHSRQRGFARILR
jgi:hypothetical protein